MLELVTTSEEMCYMMALGDVQRLADDTNRVTKKEHANHHLSSLRASRKRRRRSHKCARRCRQAFCRVTKYSKHETFVGVNATQGTNDSFHRHASTLGAPCIRFRQNSSIVGAAIRVVPGVGAEVSELHGDGAAQGKL